MDFKRIELFKCKPDLVYEILSCSQNFSLSQYFNKPIRNSFQFYDLDQRLLCLALDDK